MNDEKNKTGEAEGVGYLVREELGWSPEPIARVLTYHTTALNMQAELAVNMIERWGCIMSLPDDEGKTTGRMRTPAEVVAFSCEAAARAFEQFRDRDWLLDVPAPEIIERKEGA